MRHLGGLVHPWTLRVAAPWCRRTFACPPAPHDFRGNASQTKVSSSSRLSPGSSARAASLPARSRRARRDTLHVYDDFLDDCGRRSQCTAVRSRSCKGWSVGMAVSAGVSGGLGLVSAYRVFDLPASGCMISAAAPAGERDAAERGTYLLPTDTPLDETSAPRSGSFAGRSSWWCLWGRASAPFLRAVTRRHRRASTPSVVGRRRSNLTVALERPRRRVQPSGAPQNTCRRPALAQRRVPEDHEGGCFKGTATRAHDGTVGRCQLKPRSMQRARSRGRSELLDRVAWKGLEATVLAAGAAPHGCGRASLCSAKAARGMCKKGIT